MAYVKRWTWLIGVVKFHGYKTGAEIGLNTGKTTHALLKSCPELHLVGVDNWKTKPYVEEMFRKSLAPFSRRLRVLKGHSVLMASQVEDNSLDFVFIDADHRYKSVLADIRAWVPKVKEDGIITGHDYNPQKFPGVIKAVIECFGEQHEEANVDHVWYAKKEDYITK